MEPAQAVSLSFTTPSEGRDRSQAGAEDVRRYFIHGPAVEITCAVPAVTRAVEELLGPFADETTGRLPIGFAPTFGSIQPYDETEVMRSISPTARRRVVPSPGPALTELTEIYEEGERYWLVDDRWGLAEVNLLRGQWRSWLIPEPRIDAMRLVELSVLWPMAQLLRGKGVHLLPAASVVRDGWAMLLLCPFEIEPELTALVRAGYRIIGQRWTAVREEEGRLALLQMPGRVERPQGPRFYAADSDESPGASGQLSGADPFGPGWTDLTQTVRHSRQSHAFCDAVLVSASGRRAVADLQELPTATATAALRRAWPIIELHPSRRNSALANRFAHRCRCAEVELSRDARDLPSSLNVLRQSPFNYTGVLDEAYGDAIEGSDGYEDRRESAAA